jgi:hypothetical protein
MVLSIIFLEDKYKILLHLSIFYEYQQFFQHRICINVMFRQLKEKNKNLLRLKLKSALKIEQISVVLLLTLKKQGSLIFLIKN